MSSHEPNPDDDDTGPLSVNRIGSTTSRPTSHHEAPLTVNPRPSQRNRAPVVPIVAAAVAVVGLGALAWTFWPTDDGADSPAAETPSADEAEAQQAAKRLQAMLPEGYTADACEPVVPSNGALAQVRCAENDDVGGPLTATYTLMSDRDAVKAYFDDVVAQMSVVNCPGNIQSPGPWRRNADPDRPVGTLVCGFQESKPAVAWTTDADLAVSEVQSGPQGPNMVQLYTWWSSHS
ncbi:hypothetical protein MPNTM1_01974 [Mycolicibacterium parafortuitum]|uniref:hypothetical protein n=1 Tax=Mycolicibacterium parafortuitum TaxID=39692 RepID=UPI000CF2300C|nr:hypothetical protein CYL16_09550 [Mycobacterium sp. EPG1]